MKKAIAAIIVVVIVIAAWLFFGRNNGSVAPSPTVSPEVSQSTAPLGTVPPSVTPSSSATSSPTVTAQPKQSFSVSGNDAAGSPTNIIVAKGTLVSITFTADAQGTYHGGLDFRSSVISTGPIAPGSSRTISFTAENSFSFTPYWPATNIAKPYTINVVVK